MQLINSKTGFLVAEYRGDETIFYDRFLEAEMRKRGVSIPPPLQSSFGGKSSIRLGDKDFQRAFKEVYCTLVLDPHKHQWKT